MWFVALTVALIASPAWGAPDRELPIVGIDIIDGSRPIETAKLPERCILAFGQEGPGLSSAMLGQCDEVLHITQYGSTRSINAGAASAVAMYAWCLQHAGDDPTS